MGDMELAGKVVLVTGAGVRLGREIAEALAARGARVAVHFGSSEAAARQLAADLGGEAFGADLAQVDQVVALPGRVRAAMGGLDALVNSAAVFERQPFGEVDAAGFARHMDVDLRAPFFLAQEFVRGLGPADEGRILNLSCARGDVLDPLFPAYSLAKAGLHCMTRGLAVALAPRVRVFALALGYMIETVGGGKGQPSRQALLPGMAAPGTTGEAAAFLLGPGDFATGSVLYLDGGRHLKGASA